MCWKCLELDEEQTRLGNIIAKAIGWIALASLSIVYLIKLYCEWSE